MSIKLYEKAYLIQVLCNNLVNICNSINKIYIKKIVYWFKRLTLKYVYKLDFFFKKLCTPWTAWLLEIIYIYVCTHTHTHTHTHTRTHTHTCFCELWWLSIDLEQSHRPITFILTKRYLLSPNPKPTPYRKPVCNVTLSVKHHLLFLIIIKNIY